MKFGMPRRARVTKSNLSWHSQKSRIARTLCTACICAAITIYIIISNHDRLRHELESDRILSREARSRRRERRERREERGERGEEREEEERC